MRVIHQNLHATIDVQDDKIVLITELDNPDIKIIGTMTPVSARQMIDLLRQAIQIVESRRNDN